MVQRPEPFDKQQPMMMMIYVQAAYTHTRKCVCRHWFATVSHVILFVVDHLFEWCFVFLRDTSKFIWWSIRDGRRNNRLFRSFERWVVCSSTWLNVGDRNEDQTQLNCMQHCSNLELEVHVVCRGFIWAACASRFPPVNRESKLFLSSVMFNSN